MLPLTHPGEKQASAIACRTDYVLDMHVCQPPAAWRIKPSKRIAIGSHRTRQKHSIEAGKNQQVILT